MHGVLAVLVIVGAFYGLVRLSYDAITGQGPARWFVAIWWGWISELRKLERRPCTCNTSSGPCPRHG